MELLDLMISGVRSVDSKHVQTIHFLEPLTLISGKNGSGKTALNFMATGLLPPGGLPAFIHDIDEQHPRTDALVKLRLRDRRGRMFVVTKRLTKGSIKGKVTCKSDEFTIQMIRDGHPTKSLSAKVADTKREMLNIMQLPKAILENVVFCHQEHSCWPMSEPKELKKRFDEIFQLQKYSMAQENCAKLQKEYRAQVDVLYEREKRMLVLYKQRVKLIVDQKQANERLRTASEKLEKVRKECEDAKSSFDEAQKAFREFEKLEHDLELATSKKEQLYKRLNDLKVSDYQGSYEQLECAINEVGEEETIKLQMRSSRECATSVAETERLKEQISDCEQHCEILAQRRNAAHKLVAQAEANQKHATEARQMVEVLDEELREEFDLKRGDVEQQLQNLIKDEETQLREIQSRGATEATKLRERVDACQAEVAKLRSEKESLEKMKAAKEKEVAEAEKKTQVGINVTKEMSVLQEEITKAERELDRAPFVEQKALDENTATKRGTQEKVDNLKIAVTSAQQYADLFAAVDRAQKEADDVYAQWKETRDKHKKRLVRIFDRVPPEGPLGVNVSDVFEKVKKGLATAEEKEKKASIELTQAHAQLEQLQKELSAKKMEQESRKDEIKELTSGCKVDELADRLADVRLTVQKARKELSPLDGTQILYEEWEDEVEKKQCCPLCERTFDNKRAATTFKSKLKKRRESMPKEMTVLKKRIEEAEGREKALVEAQGIASLVKQIEGDVFALQNSVEKAEVRVEELNKEHKKAVNSAAQVGAVHGDALALQVDVSLMDSLWAKKVEKSEEVKRLREEAETFETRLPKAASLKGLKEELAIAEDDYRSLVEEGDRLQDQRRTWQQCMDKLQSLREKRLAMGETAASMGQLTEAIRTSRVQIEQFEQDIHRITQMIPGAEKTLQETHAERDVQMRRQKELEKNVEAVIQDVHRKLEKRGDAVMRLEALKRGGGTDREVLETELKAIADEERNMRARQADLQARLANANAKQAHLRTLENQLSRMEIQKSLREVEHKITSLGKSRKTREELEEELKETEKCWRRFDNEKSRLHGEKSIHEQQVTELRKQLRTKEMETAEKTYRDALFERVATERVAGDLARYSIGMDKALLDYHREKMAAINELLEDMWRKTYQGTDIEYISIRAEVVEEGEKRRSYNYCVVMVSQGQELEMRDRCSAGQRMLASILIRVALADVFGTMCSVICLDEPTTNLDTEKVDHLGEMLNDLIQSRVTHFPGYPFQLIVITHDDQLTNYLRRMARPEFSYELSKDFRGVPQIERVYVDGRKVTTTSVKEHEEFEEPVTERQRENSDEEEEATVEDEEMDDD